MGHAVGAAKITMLRIIALLAVLLASCSLQGSIKQLDCKVTGAPTSQGMGAYKYSPYLIVNTSNGEVYEYDSFLEKLVPMHPEGIDGGDPGVKTKIKSVVSGDKFRLSIDTAYAGSYLSDGFVTSSVYEIDFKTMKGMHDDKKIECRFSKPPSTEVLRKE